MPLLFATPLVPGERGLFGRSPSVRYIMIFVCRTYELFSPRTDHPSIIDDLDISGKICMICMV